MKHIDDDDLLRRFVSAFSRLDDMTLTEDEALPEELDAGVSPNDWRDRIWRPAAISTPADALSIIHSRIGDGIPALYERLVLSYRWLEVDLRVCRLLANAPGGDLKPLHDEIFRDAVMNDTLIPARLLRFAKASESYDPVCFDLSRFKSGDCPVVRLNHEAILCDDEIGEVQSLFGTFRELVETVIRLSSD